MLNISCKYDGRTYEITYDGTSRVHIFQVLEDGVPIPADSLLADKIVKRLFNGRYTSVKEKLKKA